MDDRCVMCLRKLPDDPVIRTRLVKPYGVAGRGVVYVHRDQCEARFQKLVGETTSFALHGARELLRKKYPRISGMVEQFARIRRAQRETAAAGSAKVVIRDAR